MNIEPQEGEYIAVVKKAPEAHTTPADVITPPEQILMAEAEITPKAVSSSYHRPSSIIQAQETVSTESLIEETPQKVEKPEDKHVPKTTPKKMTEEKTVFEEASSDFDIPEPNDRKVSLIISGITGASNPQHGTRTNLMKRPTPIYGPAKTGITETSTNTTYGLPVSAGVGVKYDFNDRWSLGAGINYSYLSRTFYGTYTKADENGMEISSTSSDIKNSQHFIGIPVNAYCKILDNKYVNLYAYAGATVEKCISDKYNVLSTSIIHTERPQGVQLSANAGIGVEVMLGQHLGLYVDPSVRYYFDCDQPKSIRTAQPLMLGVEMGLRVIL
jgi:hypothetical protein